VNVVSRDWVTQPLTFRHAVVSPPEILILREVDYAFQVAGGVKQLTKLIDTHRAKNSKNSDKPRNRPHGQHLSTLKEKPLPFPGKTKPISLDAIDAVWLEQHPENKTARLIHGYLKEELDDLEAEMGFADEEGFEDGAGLPNDEADGFLDPALYGSFDPGVSIPQMMKLPAPAMMKVIVNPMAVKVREVTQIASHICYISL